MRLVASKARYNTNGLVIVRPVAGESEGIDEWKEGNTLGKFKQVWTPIYIIFVLGPFRRP